MLSRPRFLAVAALAALTVTAPAVPASTQAAPAAPVAPAAPTATTVGFADVPAGMQFATEIKWLAAKGISQGWPDGTFRPLSIVTREATASFLYRLAGSPALTLPARSPFPDVSPASTHYRAIVWMVQQQITHGYGDGTFRPLSSVNRDALAAFLYRLAKGAPASLPAPAFPDVPASNPFVKEIAWLASAGVTRGWPDGTFHPLDPVRRDAMAAFIYRFWVQYKAQVATRRVTLTGDGQLIRGNGAWSFTPVFSADRRREAFFSFGSAMVPGQTGLGNIYVRDLGTPGLRWVTQGEQVLSTTYALTPDGRYLAYAASPPDTSPQVQAIILDLQTGAKVVASRGPAGALAASSVKSISIDDSGQLVAFSTEAANLVAGDTNEAADVFVFNRATGRLTRVSVTSAGGQLDGPSFGAAISGDGSTVAFKTCAHNTGTVYENFCDVIARKLDPISALEVVSVTSADRTNHRSGSWSEDPPVLSSDGRFVAFTSQDPLDPRDDNHGMADVYVRDRLQGTTELVTVRLDGGSAGWSAGLGDISADGRYVSFSTKTIGFAVGDPTVTSDVFVRDRLTGTTRRATPATPGTTTETVSLPGQVSDDGSFVALSSSVPDLVPGTLSEGTDGYLAHLLP